MGGGGSEFDSPGGENRDGMNGCVVSAGQRWTVTTNNRQQQNGNNSPGNGVQASP